MFDLVHTTDKMAQNLIFSQPFPSQKTNRNKRVLFHENFYYNLISLDEIRILLLYQNLAIGLNHICSTLIDLMVFFYPSI